MESLFYKAKAGDTRQRTACSFRVVNDCRIILEDMVVPGRKAADFCGDEFTLKKPVLNFIPIFCFQTVSYFRIDNHYYHF